MMVYLLWLGRNTCALFDFFFLEEVLGWQRTFRTPRPRSLLRNLMNTTSTTHGILCWNSHVTRMLAYT